MKPVHNIVSNLERRVKILEDKADIKPLSPRTTKLIALVHDLHTQLDVLDDEFGISSVDYEDWPSSGLIGNCKELREIAKELDTLLGG